MQGTALLDIRRSSLGYAAQPVLADVAVQLCRGDRVAIIGRSGVGKSTLLKALHAQAAQQIAYCPQDPSLVPLLSCFHNIYMGTLHQHHWSYNALNLLWPLKREIARVSEIAEAVGLGGVLFKAAGQLSGGQQQRAALARALLQGAAIFVGDEPVSAVDKQQAETLLALVHQRFETSVIALHDIELALDHCNRIIALRDGRIVLDDCASNLSIQQLKTIYQDTPAQ